VLKVRRVDYGVGVEQRNVGLGALFQHAAPLETELAGS